MNILNFNKLLKEYGLQEFPLDFEEQLNNIKKLLNQVNQESWNPLMVILSNNKYQELGFTNEDIIKLIKLYPEQLLQVDSAGWNPLMYILSNNKYQELGLKRENIIDIINLYPEQLLNIDKEGWNPLMFILRFNKTNEIGFSMEYINKLYEQQIDKNYNNIDYYNNDYNLLFNEEYILNKLMRINDLTYFHEFLDYRKVLLEKQKITNILEVNQENNTMEIINNIVKI